MARPVAAAVLTIIGGLFIGLGGLVLAVFGTVFAVFFHFYSGLFFIGRCWEGARDGEDRTEDRQHEPPSPMNNPPIMVGAPAEQGRAISAPRERASPTRYLCGAADARRGRARLAYAPQAESGCLVVREGRHGAPAHLVLLGPGSS